MSNHEATAQALLEVEALNDRLSTEIHRLNNALQAMTTQREVFEARANRATFDAAEALKDRDLWYRKTQELEAALQVSGRAVEQLQSALLQEQAKSEDLEEQILNLNQLVREVS